ncbi:MAG TPA: acyl-CoA dehydrogenase family protein [Acidimicrobiia bacterium]|nr:acyl-CoA dehydrogenase family protein [Acidimicrobiia bacterium]
MRFAFTDEQLAFRDALRDLLTQECPPARVRDAWTNPDGRTGLWPALVEMGVVGLLAPASAGGLDGTEVDLVALLEETGRHAIAEPLVETAAVAIPLLRDAHDPRVADLAHGRIVATVAGRTDEFVVWADSCDLVIASDDSGVRMFARDAVTLEPRPAIDGARRLSWLGTDDTTGEAIGDADAAALVDDRGALGTAAQLLGLTERMIDMTVAYVRDRHQFGVPVGSFQAVKHHLANARLALEFARPLVYRAAVSIATLDPHRSAHVSAGKVQANEAAALAARVALQCHGAIGYTTEYDLHLFMKRAWALARAWGDTTTHRRRVGRAIL